MIYYTTPYGNSAGEYLNEFCSTLNADDWICSTDGDTLLFGDFGKKIESLTKTGFNLIGAKTNRLNPSLCSHLLESDTFHERDVIKHYEHSELLWNKYGNLTTPTENIIAGNFMLFRVELAQKNPFDNTIRFDINFSNKIKNKGIAQGLYVFHYYRFHKNIKDISHLW